MLLVSLTLIHLISLIEVCSQTHRLFPQDEIDGSRFADKMYYLCVCFFFYIKSFINYFIRCGAGMVQRAEARWRTERRTSPAPGVSGVAS